MSVLRPHDRDSPHHATQITTEGQQGESGKRTKGETLCLARPEEFSLEGLEERRGTGPRARRADRRQPRRLAGRLLAGRREYRRLPDLAARGPSGRERGPLMPAVVVD